VERGRTNLLTKFTTSPYLCLPSLPCKTKTTYKPTTIIIMQAWWQVSAVSHALTLSETFYSKQVT